MTLDLAPAACTSADTHKVAHAFPIFDYLIKAPKPPGQPVSSLFLSYFLYPL